MKYKLVMDERTFGYTEPCLRMLRNELARRVDDVIYVRRIKVGDIGAGFLIIDLTKKEVVWTGDGFRIDNGGEGGAGMRTAEALIRIYGLSVVDGEIKNDINDREDAKFELENFLQSIDWVDLEGRAKAAEKLAGYVR